MNDGKDSDAIDKKSDTSASSDDWAAAVERWVQGGFKVEEMPTFMKQGAEEQQTSGKPGPTEAPGEKVAARREASDVTRVAASEPKSDLPQLDEIVQGFLDTSLPQPPTGEHKESAEATPEKVQIPAGAESPAVQPPLAASTAQPRRKRSFIIRTLGWPPPLAFGLGALVLALAGLAWRFFIYENPLTIPFPAKKISAEVISAPAPADYSAKPKATYHYSRGNRFAHLGRFTEAIAEYQQALREDPDYPHPHRALGVCYAAVGEGSLAAISYRNYLKLAPESPDVAQVREILKRYPGK